MNHKDVRKYFFGFRVIEKWNDLNEAVKAGSIYSFKSKYNRTQEAKRD